MNELRAQNPPPPGATMTPTKVDGGLPPQSTSAQAQVLPPQPQKPIVKIPIAIQPMVGPPSPLSTDKQQRLATLLEKYKADQLTPEQYHAERAKILAGP